MPRARLGRPRAARARARPSRFGAAARVLVSRAPAPADDRGCRVIQPKTSTAAPTAPIALAARALPASRDRRASGEDVAGRGRDEQRPDQMRAAALVLLRAPLAVLVRSRSRRARRRGRRRARPRAAPAGPERARERPETNSRAMLESRNERRATWTVSALAIVAASTRGARRGGAPPAGCAAPRGGRRTTRRAAGGRVGTVSSRRGEEPLPAGGDLDLARRRCGPRRPTTSARARARRSRAPSRRAGACRSQPCASERSFGDPPERAPAARRPAGTSADRRAVERDDGHHLPDGRGRERLVGAVRAARARSAPSSTS